MQETWYVLEDGSSAHPGEVTPDDKGVLRHKSGKAVAMKGQVPHTRGVDPVQEGARANKAAKDLKAEDSSARSYKTRESKAD